MAAGVETQHQLDHGRSAGRGVGHRGRQTGTRVPGVRDRCRQPELGWTGVGHEHCQRHMP